MRLIRRTLQIMLLLLLIALLIVVYFIANPNLPDYKPADKVHYLGQWSEQERQFYYYTPQGTRVKGLQYAWFSTLR